jgi:hypothetical protein
MKISIKTTKVELEAELLNNNTSKKIAEILPIEGKINTWGEEIYFEVPLYLELDDSAKEIVEKGDLGFWPSGNCFCIFFGKTPTSNGDEIRPASAVNVFGKVYGNLEILRTVNDGEFITISKI